MWFLPKYTLAKNPCAEMVQKITALHHVDLTNMGKYHVCYVTESRDVTPCGRKCNEVLTWVERLLHHVYCRKKRSFTMPWEELS